MRTQPSKLIWNDRGSGADKDGSFWEASIPKFNRYRLLGDAACGQSNEITSPCESILMILDNNDGVVKAPVKSERIWTDAGSGADQDVSIWRLVPPSGYKCLGMAAVRRHNPGPDLQNYRCVKKGLKSQFGSKL